MGRLLRGSNSGKSKSSASDLRVSMLLNPKRIATLHSRVSILSLLRRHSTLPPNPNPTTPLTKPQLKALVINHYSRGKFSNLIQNVVASPPVLLLACQNLTPRSNDVNSLASPAVALRFSVEELGRELGENRFDVESCCVRMVPHTAIRYLKNSVQNPNWWFKVTFDREKFEHKNVNKLCLIIEEKIKDTVLIGIVRKLFECEVLQIELGGCYLGRGFPQECGLSSILINVYFNGFDKEIQDLRIRTNQENPRFDSNEVLSGSSVFYKPVKIYAVRYLDEILVITSGSKMLTMDLKNQVMKFLEGKLELKVDRLKMAIHSATMEKIDFLGMELQAVQPSVLRPPMSEKAIRAQKKYLRQKEVKAIELRNARETNRKKLGLKILAHVFKKLKQSDEFKFDFHIENEVREIFRTWADEVVKEFLGSLEEQANWYRMLSVGDFLSLRHIRHQLPQELVDAYDHFQEQVDKHIKPVKARKALEEAERRVVEEEEQKYAERTVQELTRLCMKVDAPIELLLIALEDTDIIKWYAAEKHESTKLETIRHYTKDLKVSDFNGIEEVHFPAEREIKMMGDKNLSDPKPVDGALSLALIRLASDEPAYSCVAHFCDRKDTIVYRVRLLQNRLNVNPLDEKKWVPGMGAIHEGLNRKCLPLCSDHIHDLYMGTISLQDIDCTSFVDVD
ncbi:unnamed protein product, partial [Vitis vinifera]